MSVMLCKSCVYIRIFLIYSLISQTYSAFEFTNIKCTSFDETFATFKHCFLKSVNRTYKYGSVTTRLHQGPVDKIRVNVALYKRLNGFKPFLYNITVDACKFIKKPKNSPVGAFIFNLFGPFSNINHSCPFDNDVIVDKAPISHMDEQLTKILPFPTGEYGFFSIWYANGIKRTTVNVYGTLS